MSPLEGRVMDCSTHSSLTMAFVGMGWWGWCQLYTACLFVPSRELQGNFFSMHQTFIEQLCYYVPGIVFNVTIRQGGWKPPLPQLGPVRRMHKQV